MSFREIWVLKSGVGTELRQFVMPETCKIGWILQRLLCPPDPRISWWRHQMETFSALLAICAGNSPVPGEFPAQRPLTRSFDVFFDLRLINGWVNNRKAGDLRRYRAHHDVMVMLFSGFQSSRELWNSLSKTVLSKHSFIWNKGPLNIWNYHKAHK